MKYKYIAAVLASLTLAACGGGGDSTPASSTKTGVFLDSPVSGIQYTTKNAAGDTTHTGTTNSLGEYQYDTGDTVTFSIGNLDFPAGPTGSVVTPLTLIGGSTDITTNQTASNIARLLQSLDDDGNPANGINIHSNAATAVDTALAIGPISFSDNTATFESNAAIVSLVANSGSTNTALVTEAAAQAHIVATNEGRILGAWQSTGAGGAFSYLIMFSDNTFAYGENDPAASAPENGLEVGTYSYDTATGNVTFNISYDDNAPGLDSGVGDIGTPAVIDAVLSNGDATLTVAGGAVSMTAIDFAATPFSGVWRNSGVGGAFEILLITDDGTIVLAENDVAAPPPQNGLEVGTYSYNSATSNVTINLVYDDNDPGNDSGLGNIGTPAVFDAILSNSNNTLTVAGGAIIFNREF